jgi:hypothetical protein
MKFTGIFFLALFIFGASASKAQCNNFSIDMNGASAIIIRDSASLRPNYLTISLYFKTTSTAMQALVNKVDTLSGNYLQYGMTIDHTSFSPLATYITSTVHSNPSCVAGNGMKLVKYQNGYVPLNTWYNIVFTYDGSYQYLYLNGNLIASYYAAAGVIQNCAGGQLLIGQYVSSLPCSFEGKVDEIALFNRALSAGEIQSKYNTVLNPKVETGLIAYYRCEEGSGGTVADISGKGNNGILKNCSWSTDVPFVPATTSCVPACVSCKSAGLNLNDSLQLCIPFNNSVQDESGKANTATAYNLSYTTDRNNSNNKSALFNGSSTRVVIPYTSAFSFNNNSAFSVSFWMNPSVAGTYATMITKCEQSATSGFAIGFDNAGRLRFITDLLYSITTPNTIPLNVWTHIVVTFNSKNNIRIYLNGTMVASGSVSNMNSNTTAFTLGRLYNSLSGNDYNGKLDEVRIYKSVLSVSDIANMYYSNEKAVIQTNNDTTVCPGSQITLGTSGSANKFLWSTGETVSSITININKDTILWVRGQVDTGSCFSYDTVKVMVYPVPVISAGNDTSICDGETAVLNASGTSDKYLWSTGDTTASISVNPSVTTGYWLRGNKTGQPCFAYDTIKVTVNPMPVLSTLPDLDVCKGSVLQIQAGGTADRFLWSTGDTTQTLQITANASGTYWLRGQIGTAACYSFDTFTVTVWNNVTINAGNDTAICRGDIARLTASGSCDRFMWSTGDTSRSIIVYPSNTTVYWVRGNKAGELCYRFDSVKVTVNPIPVIFGNSDFTVCKGTIVQLQATGTANRYLWNTGDTTPTITRQVNSTAKYWVRGQTGIAPCYATDTINITVENYPVITTSTDTAICFGSYITLKTAGTATRYLWSNGDTTASIFVSPAISQPYWVRGQIGSSSCFSYDTVNVTVMPFPNLALPPDTTICSNDSIELKTIGNASSFLWSTGATTSSVWVKPGITTSYWVRGNIGTSACYSFDTIQVITKPQPPQPHITLSGIFLISDALTGNQWYKNYSLIPGATGQVFTPVTSGLYSVKVAGNGCFSDMSNYIQFNLTGISPNAAQGDFYLHPNPAGNTISLYNGLDMEYTLMIYNTAGQSMMEEKRVQKGVNTIDLADLPAGIYIFRIANAGTTTVYKVVKQ